eukprot:24726-Prymnesium_polylepis.1
MCIRDSLSTVRSSPVECQAWAAEAMAGICSRADASSAQAVRLGAVAPLLGKLGLVLAGGTAADEA